MCVDANVGGDRHVHVEGPADRASEIPGQSGRLEVEGSRIHDPAGADDILLAQGLPVPVPPRHVRAEGEKRMKLSVGDVNHYYSW